MASAAAKASCPMSKRSNRELELMVHLTLAVLVQEATDPAAIAMRMRIRSEELAARADTAEDAALYRRVADELTDMLIEHTEIKREVYAIFASPRILKEGAIHG